MRLYLVRHACPKEPTGDAPLGDQGIKQATMLGKLFAALPIKPQALKVISSRCQRARQTTTLICQELGIADEVLIFPTPTEESSDIDLINQQLMKHLQTITGEEGYNEVIVINHHPYLCKSLAWLLGNDTMLLPDIYGATACLTCDLTFAHGAGVLEWLIAPVVL